MKKHVKILLFLIVVVLCVVSLTACDLDLTSIFGGNKLKGTYVYDYAECKMIDDDGEDLGSIYGTSDFASALYDFLYEDVIAEVYTNKVVLKWGEDEEETFKVNSKENKYDLMDSESVKRISKLFEIDEYYFILENGEFKLVYTLDMLDVKETIIAHFKKQ